MKTEQLSLGLKENRKQFTILVIVNAFVGGMIGMERTIFSQFAELEFGSWKLCPGRIAIGNWVSLDVFP